MYFTAADIKNIDESKLSEFLKLGMREGHYLDYKAALSGTSVREQRIEFLKDVTAFANAAGGDILLGVKEPSDGLSPSSQLLGIAGGDQLATGLERIAASSIDPRIPGLEVKPIPIAGRDPAIVVHVPPSLSRPHRVDYQGHVGFYIRHSESSLPMTTHEIRESVLTAASAEATARAYLREQESLLELYEDRRFPAIFMQAMPLIALEQHWDVLGDAVRTAILAGGEQQFGGYGLRCHNDPSPTIDGVTWHWDRKREPYRVDIHRNGYLSAVQSNKDKDEELRILTPSHCKVFTAFCLLCRDILAATSTDLPYVLRCKYFRAVGAVFETRPFGFPERSDHFQRSEIVWPDQIRQVGEDFTRIANAWCDQMYYAFGLRPPTR